ILYVMGIVLAFVSPWLSVAMYVLVAVMWLIPDRRIERILNTASPSLSLTGFRGKRTSDASGCQLDRLNGRPALDEAASGGLGSHWERLIYSSSSGSSLRSIADDFSMRASVRPNCTEPRAIVRVPRAQRTCRGNEMGCLSSSVRDVARVERSKTRESCRARPS